MSSTIFSQQNPSPVQTRRTQTRNENAHKTNDRRSLSGKFRNLFRKNSASPTRTITNPEHLNPAASASPAIAYQRSTSPETISASTEAPHLRAPSVNWPFGKKKAKSPTRKNESTNGKTKTKTKDSKKNKKVTITPLEISGPIHHQQQQQEYQTLIHDQNFVPKTPEFPHGSIGRTNSSPPYETTTKGFRDFMVIDHSNTSQQEMTSRADAITPLPYTSNHNYSPSMNHHRLPDTNIEYSYHQDTSSPPISDTEIFLTPKQRRKLNDTPSLTATQMLIENTPTRPVTSKFSPSKQHPQSRTAYYNPPDTPATYRSSTTIFTKNKNDFIDGGELRTWSIHDTDDLDSHKKTSTAIHVERKYNNHDTVLPTITNEYQYNSRNHERETNRDEMQEENYIIAYEYGLHDQPQYLYDQQQYSNNRFSHNVNNDIISSYTRSPTTIERDKIYDRTTRSYQNLEHIQEPLNGKTPVENSDASLRHYILKRSDSYDGLGILISADAKTGLNPRIRDVELGSPGHRAGLRKDDRIIYVNGISAENRDFSEVLILVQEGLNNNNLKFSVIHESINF
ncbi:unnamed protein product [Rotaria magnacalcarata]|uniref:PDZ domain-containing protein n=1 Tax=Rotaria magnacalcarata TaxID=392030 RepID=A0A8S2QVL9_9BILA|nr:unnamed protein product [Rotaria magnacalcarata]